VVRVQVIGEVRKASDRVRSRPASEMRSAGFRAVVPFESPPLERSGRRDRRGLDAPSVLRPKTVLDVHRDDRTSTDAGGCSRRCRARARIHVAGPPSRVDAPCRRRCCCSCGWSPDHVPERNGPRAGTEIEITSCDSPGPRCGMVAEAEGLPGSGPCRPPRSPSSVVSLRRLIRAATSRSGRTEDFPLATRPSGSRGNRGLRMRLLRSPAISRPVGKRSSRTCALGSVPGDPELSRGPLLRFQASSPGGNTHSTRHPTASQPCWVLSPRSGESANTIVPVPCPGHLPRLSRPSDPRPFGSVSPHLVPYLFFSKWMCHEKGVPPSLT